MQSLTSDLERFIALVERTADALALVPTGGAVGAVERGIGALALVRAKDRQARRVAKGEKDVDILNRGTGVNNVRGGQNAPNLDGESVADTAISLDGIETGVS